MLPAAARMRRSAEFRTTLRGGSRAANPALVLHLGPPAVADGGAPRVGFIVSRSVGSAVVRNQVRRRLRHVMRDRLAALPPGSRLVVRAQPAAATLSAPALAAQLDRALATALGRWPGTRPQP